MPDLSASVELVRREASEALARPLPPMDDHEVAALWRTAKALAESGLFKDARQAGQAFAKILAGRDLGLTPFESMSSLHVIEGKIEASGDLHATRVRQRDGYDFEVWWIKESPRVNVPNQPPQPPQREAVRAADEEPTDLRETVGCSLVFTVDGERRGVSRWTIEDSERAQLLKPNSNHAKFARNMYFNRAMTNGVAWYVPEVMGGLRVYAAGELGQGESGEDLGAGAGGAAPAMDTLPTAVEAVIARAAELGHAGLANRERWATVAGQADVGQAVARATRELNAYAARKRRGEPEPAEPEPPDADVVRCGAPDGGRDGVTCELDRGHEGAHRAAGEAWDVFVEPQSENERVSGDDPGEGPTGTGEAADGAQAPQGAPQAPESAEEVDGVVGPGDRGDQLRAIAARLLEDADAAEADGQPDEAERLRDDAAGAAREADALGDADQSSLGL